MSSSDLIVLEKVIEDKQSTLAPDSPAHEYFGLFAVEQVLKDYDLSYAEIDGGIVDGGDDGGIDFIYMFVNGMLIADDDEIPEVGEKPILDLILIQSKSGKSFKESVVARFRNVTDDLLDLNKSIADFEKVYNEKLREKLGRFKDTYLELASKFPHVHIAYYYVSKGDTSTTNPKIESHSDSLMKIVRNLYSDAEVSIDLVGASELLSRARTSPKSVHALRIAEAISSEKAVGFVCLVSIKDYYGFITDELGRVRTNMFEANVRDYQGAVEVNSEIQKTLEGEPTEDFWWLNNGITMLASQATQAGKVLNIENPYVVNGLQTSTEIVKYFGANPDAEDERHLLVRIIVPNEEASSDRIIKATNSQTQIPSSQLRATEKIHRDIEEYLKSTGIYYDRRKNFYKNEGRPVARIISISQLAQSVMAIALQRPNDARARPSSLLKDDENYKAVFDPDYPIDLYRACAHLSKRVDEFLRTYESQMTS